MDLTDAEQACCGTVLHVAVAEPSRRGAVCCVAKKGTGALAPGGVLVSATLALRLLACVRCCSRPPHPTA